MEEKQRKFTFDEIKQLKPLIEQVIAESIVANIINNAVTKDDITNLKGNITSVKADLKEDINGVREELKEVKADLKEDYNKLEHKIEQCSTKDELNKVEQRLDARMDKVEEAIKEVKTELKDDIKGVEIRLNSRIDKVEQGLMDMTKMVVQLTEKSASRFKAMIIIVISVAGLAAGLTSTIITAVLKHWI